MSTSRVQKQTDRQTATEEIDTKTDRQTHTEAGRLAGGQTESSIKILP